MSFSAKSGSLLVSTVRPPRNLGDHFQAVICDSYYIPTAEERDVIQSLVRKTREKRVHTNDADLERLCKSALSTLRRLPTEILEDIISMGWSESRISARDWCYYRYLSNTMLVCRRWRDVVQSYQPLWANLYINSHIVRQGTERLECLIRTHKRFCHKLPWNVHLMESLKGHPSHREALVDLLLDTRDRWCSLTLGVDEFTQMLFAPPYSFSSLGEDAQTDFPAFPEVMLPYPKVALTPVPWSQLTKLSIGAIAERDLGHLIPQLTNVGRLRLNLHEPIASASSLIYKTTNTLHTLCLGFSDSHTSLNTTLRRIQIPHLRSLRLTRMEHAVFSGLRVFFSHPSHRSLVSLLLEFFYFTYDNARFH